MPRRNIKKGWKATFEFDGNGKLIGVFDTGGKPIKEIRLPDNLTIKELKTYSVLITDVDTVEEATCKPGCLKIVGGIPMCVC